MSSPRFVRAAVLATALAAALAAAPARPAHAAPPPPGISLTWNDCPGGLSASSGITYACSGNADTMQLVCSLVVQNTISGVLGAELVIDIQHSDPINLPDWWRFDGSGTGGCRAGGIDIGFDFGANPGCTDTWLGGNPFGGNQGFSIGPPDHPFMNQARLKAVVAVLSGHAVTLVPGTTYGLLKVLINSYNTTGPGACAGCGGSACLVFNSAWILVQPGSGSNVFLSSPASPESNWATWQGTAANCVAVPVRHTTWGQIKSLYH